MNPPPPRSYSHTATNSRVLAEILSDGIAGQRILDVGAGEGFFTSLVGDEIKRRGFEPSEVITACDLNPENFRYPDCRCMRIDANGRLPFEDDSFDVVCSIEVIEHLEDQFAFTRELYRITRPGGKVIVTTPNILNINSRVRNLVCGFGLLFNPLKLEHDRRGDAVHASSGHIHPVSYYFLAYQFHRAGFTLISALYDRHKKSAFGWLLVFWPLVATGFHLFRRKLARKSPETYAGNLEFINELNSIGMLTARTVIVRGRKQRRDA